MQAKFLNDYTDVRILREREGMFRVLNPVSFQSAKFERVFTVPSGYDTDFASIPQFLKDRIDVNGRHREAAIVHDYGCTNGDEWGLTQKQVDGLLLEAMTALGVGRITRTLMYYGVRGYQSVKGLF